MCVQRFCAHRASTVDENGCPGCPKCLDDKTLRYAQLKDALEEALSESKCTSPICEKRWCRHTKPTVDKDGCPGCPKCLDDEEALEKTLDKVLDEVIIDALLE